MFLTLTLPNGLPLDIPAASVVFLETLDPDSAKANPGCKTGLFFDLGNGAQSAVAREPFPKLQKAIAPARPGEFMTVTNVHKGKVLMLKANVLSLRGLADDHPNDGKCQISHRIIAASTAERPGGPRVLLLDVLEANDEVKALMQVPSTAEKTDGSDSPDE